MSKAHSSEFQVLFLLGREKCVKEELPTNMLVSFSIFRIQKIRGVFIKKKRLEECFQIFAIKFSQSWISLEGPCTLHV